MSRKNVLINFEVPVSRCMILIILILWKNWIRILEQVKTWS